MQTFIISLQDHEMIYIYQLQTYLYFRGEWIFSGVKIFNSLPLELKQIFHDTGKFKNALKRFLLVNSFYSLEEYHNWGK